MFFVDASELGQAFFSPIHYGQFDTPERAAANRTATQRLQQIEEWLGNVMIPAFNQANPHRQIGTTTHIPNLLPTPTDGSNCDIHLDVERRPTNELRVNIATESDGSFNNTIFPKDLSVTRRDQNVDIWRESLDEHFYIPPPGHLVVFDPDLEWHAEPPRPLQSPDQPLSLRRLYSITYFASDTSNLVVPEIPPGSLFTDPRS